MEDTHLVQLYLGNSLLLAKEKGEKMKGENAGAEAQILHLGSYCSLLCHQDVVSVKGMHVKAPPPQARAQAPEVMNSDEFNKVLIRCTLVYIPTCWQQDTRNQLQFLIRCSVLCIFVPSSAISPAWRPHAPAPSSVPSLPLLTERAGVPGSLASAQSAHRCDFLWNHFLWMLLLSSTSGDLLK